MAPALSSPSGTWLQPCPSRTWLQPCPAEWDMAPALSRRKAGALRYSQGRSLTLLHSQEDGLIQKLRRDARRQYHQPKTPGFSVRRYLECDRRVGLPQDRDLRSCFTLRKIECVHGRLTQVVPRGDQLDPNFGARRIDGTDHRSRPDRS